MDAIHEYLRNVDLFEHDQITMEEYDKRNEILRNVEPVREAE